MSARQSLRAVRDAKARGMTNVTCEVAPHHFVLTDEALETPIRYDTNVKMNPPLREAADRDAMLDGIADGTVDVIATDHAPHHADEKLVEFDRAPFGIVGLETCVPLVFDRLVHAGRIGDRPRHRAALGEPRARVPRCPAARWPTARRPTSRSSRPTRRSRSAPRRSDRNRRTRRSTAGSCRAPSRRRSSAAGSSTGTSAVDVTGQDPRSAPAGAETAQEFEVLMRDGHFDYGNGFHGRVYLNRTSCSGIRRRSGGWRRICSTCCRAICSSRPRSSPGR